MTEDQELVTEITSDEGDFNTAVQEGDDEITSEMIAEDEELEIEAEDEEQHAAATPGFYGFSIDSGGNFQAIQSEESYNDILTLTAEVVAAYLATHGERVQIDEIPELIKAVRKALTETIADQ